jgi:hypothetical protein
MVATACKAGQLAPAGDARLTVNFEVRLYRAKREGRALTEAIWQSALAG